MGSSNNEIQSKSIISKTDGRIVQKFTIVLTGAKSEKKKPNRGLTEPTMKFRGAEEPEAEIITSEHVEAKRQKIDGRHGG